MKTIKKLWQKLSVNLLLIKYKLRYLLLDIQTKWYEFLNPSYIEHIQKKDIEPIFIVGSGRSGNTLLARIIHESGNVCFPPENFTLWEVYNLYLKNIKKNWNQRVDIVIDKMLSQKDSFRWGKVDIYELKEELYNSDEQTLGNIIDKWYINYTKHLGYPSKRWGCKTPNLTPHIHNFIKIYPNMKLVNILRKPSDVIKSYSSTNIEEYNNVLSSITMWIFRLYYMKKLKYTSKIILFSNLINDVDNEKKSLFEYCNINTIVFTEFENPDLEYEHMSNVKKNIGTLSLHKDLKIDLKWFDNIYYKEINNEKD